MLQQTHKHSLRVYAEDTDMMGLVYHSNHLCFLERARSELLRSYGFPLSTLAEYDCQFAIKEAQLRYLKPARLDDWLTIETKIEKTSACTLLFKHNIVNEAGDKLCEADVQTICVNNALKPKRLPAFLFEAGIATK